MHRLLLLTAFLWLVDFRPAWAQIPDDEYVRIYYLIQQADRLVSTGQPSQAKEKYVEAQAALRALQSARPDWNPQVIQFRLRYILEKLQLLSAGNEAKPEVEELPRQPSVATDSSGEKIEVLQGQIRRLLAEKELLQAKLKEALSAQPAAIDPRELKKAEERIKTLEKEAEILRVNLRKAQSAPDRPADPALLEKTQTALADADEKLRQHSESMAALRLENQALQGRLRAFADGSEVAALKEENGNLRQQVDALKGKAEDGGVAAQLKKQIAALQAEAAAHQSRNDLLSAEKRILEKRLNELATLRDAELTAKTRALEKERDDARAQARTSAATVSALQMALRKANDETASLENAKRAGEIQKAGAGKFESAPHPSAVSAAERNPTDARRVRQLERERDELQKKFNAATRELFDNKSQGQLTYLAQITNHVADLRARLEVLEARRVPYSAEEIALLQIPELKPVKSEPPERGTARDQLPAGAVRLVAEAERAFGARRLEEAEKKYEEVLRLDDGNVAILANLAAVQIERSRLEEAEKTLKRVLAQIPRDAFSLSLLGVIKVRQAKFDEALEALSRSAQSDPRNAETQNYLGIALVEKGLRGPAESAFRRALQLSPGHADAHHNLAVVYAAQQPPSVELARWHYEKALAAGHRTNPELEKTLNRKKSPGASK